MPKAKSPDHIARPMNPFFIYRLDRLPDAMKQKEKSNSGIIAQWWKNEPAEVKELYALKAKELKRWHERTYPYYKYKPVRKNKSKPKGQASKNVSKTWIPSQAPIQRRPSSSGLAELTSQLAAGLHIEQYRAPVADPRLPPLSMDQGLNPWDNSSALLCDSALQLHRQPGYFDWQLLDGASSTWSPQRFHDSEMDWTYEQTEQQQHYPSPLAEPCLSDSAISNEFPHYYSAPRSGDELGCLEAKDAEFNAFLSPSSSIRGDQYSPSGSSIGSHIELRPEMERKNSLSDIFAELGCD